MIPDHQTNFVYIADTLTSTYPTFAKEFLAKLKAAGIPMGILPGTKDVWAVDYMPIQVSESKFVRFSYKPDYLVSSKKWSKTISDVDAICEAVDVKTVKSDIILDGGNLSKWYDRVMMTTKVFMENKHIPELELIEQLKNLLEVNDLFFVPVEKGDWLGHVDGMARFIAKDTVLINDYSKEPQENYIDFLGALHNAGLQWKTFPFNIYENEDVNDATGLYLNYLELQDHIVLPIFDNKTENEIAKKKAKEIFPKNNLITVVSTKPAKNTGIINCMTWNIKR